MTQVYVKAESKKQLNERLAAGAEIYAIEHRMGAETLYLLQGGEPALPDRAVIKIYSRTINGAPYAKAYGVWNADRKRVK
jgi:hypothetical protein